MGLRGAIFTIGLWFDQPIFPSALLAVGDVLVAARGQYVGDVKVGSSVAFADPYDIDDYRSLDRRVVEGTMPGTVEGTVYRLGLRLPVVGEAQVQFERTRKAVPAQDHPIGIDMSAELAGGMYHSDRRYKNQAKAQERAFVRLLRALCTALDPAYAVMGEEIIVPSPSDLADGSDTLCSDAFISQRLATRPGLEAPLAGLAQLCKTQDWGAGTHYEWGPARRDRDREALRAADKAASMAVGRALTLRARS